MLTNRQRRFVEAYLLDPNGEKAAIAAGYSAHTARVQAYQLLRHPRVAEELARRRDATSRATGITPELVIAELAKLGFSDIRQVVRWRANVAATVTDDNGEDRLAVQNEVVILDSDQITDQAAAAIAEVSQSKDGTLKVKMHDKLGALVKIGQHLGMFRPVSDPERPGKKQQNALDAKKAEEGTGWDGLIN